MNEAIRQIQLNVDLEGIQLELQEVVDSLVW